MTTLAEHMIVACADNHPPMLEKSMYTSWSSRMLLYIKDKEHGRMMLNLVQNGPLVYPTIEVDGVTRLKTYEELSDKEKLQDDCDLRATNIVLQGLPPNIYALFSHNQLYAYLSQHKGHENEVRLMRGRYQNPLALALISHLPSLVPQHAYQAPSISQQPQAEFPQLDSELVVPSFLPRDDPIASLNKAMAFLIQQVQGRQTQGYAGNSLKCNATALRVNKNRGNNTACQAKESSQVLDEEQLAFLVDPRILVRQDTLTTMPINAAFQTDDLDAFNSDYDEAPGAQAVLMANLSGYDSDVIFEVHNFENYQNNDVSDMCVQEESYSEQLAFSLNPDIDITSDSNIITYEKYLQETESAHVQNNTSFDQQNAMIMLVFDAVSDQVAKCTADNQKHKELDASLTAELERYKERLSKLAEDFGKCFVPQKELSAEQALWLPISNPIFEQLFVQTTPVRMEAPSELPKVSMVKTSFQKLKNHLASFDKVVKVRTIPIAIIEGSSGFKHTKAIFNQELIPFIKTLRDLFKDFDNGLHSELNEMKMVFNQMEAAVEQYVMNIMMHADSVSVSVLSANNKCLVNDNLKSKWLIQENYHLFKLLLSQDIVHICVNSLATLTNYAKMERDYIDEYSENLVLKADLAKKEQMVKKKFFDEVVFRCSRLENRNVNLELELQHQKESFLNNRPLNNQNAPEILEIFKINEWQAKSNKKQTWKPTGKEFTDIGYRWKPTRRTFTIVGNSCPLTRITSTKVEPLKETTLKLVSTTNPKIKIYRRKTKVAKSVDLSSEPSCPDCSLVSGLSMLQVYDRKPSQAINFVNYFWRSIISRDTNLYTISLDDMLKSSMIYLLSKASKTKSWLWH
ncbi:hypothetical protein Tco_1155010 [Tanacetum coccineum]